MTRKVVPLAQFAASPMTATAAVSDTTARYGLRRAQAIASVYSGHIENQGGEPCRSAKAGSLLRPASDAHVVAEVTGKRRSEEGRAAEDGHPSADYASSLEKEVRKVAYC